MIKAVRICARQQMTNYRKPASFLIKESYPLPPYSSVIGLTHNMCGWQKYHPLRVSVQGKYASTVSDYATNYAFGAIPLDRAHHIINCGDGKQTGVVHMPRSYELLTDVELMLHIIPHDETLVDEIYSSLASPPVYPSLGRYEDLLQIEDINIVELDCAPETVTTRFDAYVPVDSIDTFYNKNISGTIYRIGKVFEYDDGKNKSSNASGKSSRIWKEVVMVRHICQDVQLIASDGIYYDSQKSIAVFPA